MRILIILLILFSITACVQNLARKPQTEPADIETAAQEITPEPKIPAEQFASVAASVVSGGKRLCTVIGKPITNCKFSFALSSDVAINSSFIGKKITITQGLADLSESDDDLAIILAHEYAHNIFNDKVINTPYPEKLERRADYIGLYIAALAGYDISNANKLWGKIAEKDANSSYIATHTFNEERYDYIKQTIDEIAAKQKKGDSMIPNIK
jgi:predicted Zn-dependent protease